MATLALAAAGAAVGGALLPAGVTVLGATIAGATIGSQIGALAGSYIDQALFATGGQSRGPSGPRLSDLKITASTEGAAVPRLYGRARLGGQVIWAADIEETVVSSQAGGGGKGSLAPGGGASSSQSYRYFSSFAVALCEGPVTSVGRVWADGRELDLSEIAWRLHPGDAQQAADSLIVAHQGADSAPAYRGIAYIVFERLDLTPFGNRIPQLSFEVLRSVDPFEDLIRAVVLIPGSGEFVYATEPVTRRTGAASTTAENQHTLMAATDWVAAIDQLDASLPNARSTSLVVSWFGSDLRAGQCQLRPAVDSADKETTPLEWSVAGLGRAGATLISQSDGRAAYGGTPSDQTVVAAIRDLKARGHLVTLTPFILMDVPAGNALPDPYAPTGTQPTYPWRGRITVSPAPGVAGSPDKTSAAASQIAAFVGTAMPSHFTLAGETVVYSGPAEWSFRRMILHYAKLAQAAGGVDAFIIGSELRGLTQARSSSSSYPFVTALSALAADVKAILGSATKVTYAADWSEYFGHHPSDGSGDVYFHLDPLWASSAIDAIAIDCYWPLSDWRDSDSHLDRAAGARSIYDLDYLKSNLHAGEGFDWYYATAADRLAQVRTPITDGAGKPWVFRYKDVKSWWQHQHFNRPAGVESASPTAWTPQSKPIWLTEIGCPSIDKGANQPNVFIDPKSSESYTPYFSRGTRDDLMQRRYLQAILEALDPDHPGHLAGANPVSTVYGGRMIDLAHVHLYAWDARPYPTFPVNAAVWGDSQNWRLGHWIQGRTAGQSLASVVAQLLHDYEFDAYDGTALNGIVSGLLIERSMSGRDALSPLELAYFFDAIESDGQISFRHRGQDAPVALISADDLVETRPGSSLLTLTRAQETELPASARISYTAIESDYRQAVAASHRLVGASGRLSIAELALVMDAEQASQIADSWLFEAWAARERVSLTLPPSQIALEPSDLITLDHGDRERLVRITGIGDRGPREIEARSIDPSIYSGVDLIQRPQPNGRDIAVGQPLGLFLDLPQLPSSDSAEAGYVAATRTPWPGGVAFYRSSEDAGFSLAAIAERQATTGNTLDPVPPGIEGRLDHATRVRVRLDWGQLTSLTRLAMLGGGNAAVIQAPDGGWEILQFETATLVASGTYELSTLLRGQLGTEAHAATTIPAGARFVLLNEAVTTLPQSRDQIGLALQWRYGPSTRDIGHRDFVSASYASSGRGFKPFSPAHIRGSRSGGDLAISWIRRTRLGGDSWLASDVPLGEDTESYDIEVLAGSTIKRTLTSSTPSVLYTSAHQIADFGSLQSAVTVRIAQRSAFLGRGTPRTAIV